MIKRVTTAILLILVMGLGIWLQGWPLRVILLISMVMSLLLRLSMVLVAIMAGTLHPNPIIIGMNDLP